MKKVAFFSPHGPLLRRDLHLTSEPLIWPLGAFLLYRVCSVKTFLSDFENGWLKYCAKEPFWGGQGNILRVILET